jgi:hypothetical protein
MLPKNQALSMDASDQIYKMFFLGPVHMQTISDLATGPGAWRARAAGSQQRPTFGGELRGTESRGTDAKKEEVNRVKGHRWKDIYIYIYIYILSAYPNCCPLQPQRRSG